MSRWELARAVADAVLFEGYALYPYRASAAKNRLRFQLGVVAPRPPEGPAASPADPWWLEAGLLVEGEAGAWVDCRVRFLRLTARRVLDPEGAPVERLEVEGEQLLAWDEGAIEEVELSHRLGAIASQHDFQLAGGVTSVEVLDRAGAPAARVVRRRAPLRGRVLIEEEVLAGEGLVRLRLRLENHSEAGEAGMTGGPGEARDLTRSLVAAHALVAVRGAALLSVIDPPERARAAARATRPRGWYPVLLGEPGSADLALCSPIILYDHPAVAPESAGDWFDAGEIDELLALRTLLLTEEEKAEARATEARLGELVARAESLASGGSARLHGTLRRLRPDGQMTPLGSGPGALLPGTRVRLHPRLEGGGPRDPQDRFLAGRSAIVRRLERDLEDRRIVAVSLDDEGAAGPGGRHRYFLLDEVEPIEGSPGARAGDPERSR